MSKEKENARISIEIPQSLFERLKKSAESGNYGSVEECIVYLLRKAVSGDEKEEETYSEEEQEKIKERLKSLGYLE